MLARVLEYTAIAVGYLIGALFLLGLAAFALLIIRVIDHTFTVGPFVLMQNTHTLFWWGVGLFYAAVVWALLLIFERLTIWSEALEKKQQD